MKSENPIVVRLFKHGLNRLGRPYGINPFPQAFENGLTPKANDRSSVFENIYNTNFWGSNESRSGVGSEREFTTRYRNELSALVREHNIQSMFDGPCGDLNWMQEFLQEHPIRYVGGDIVQSVVDDVLLRFPQRDVRRFDICHDAFPDVDVWHCRDCLFHLPFADIKQAFENFVASRIPHVLFTTHRARFLHRNLNVSMGGFRLLDLERAPFGFPPAVRYVSDYQRGVDFPRFVGLWPREVVAESLKRWPRDDGAAR